MKLILLAFKALSPAKVEIIFYAQLCKIVLLASEKPPRINLISFLKKSEGSLTFEEEKKYILLG